MPRFSTIFYNDFHDVACSPVIGGTRQEWEQAIRCDNSLLKWKQYSDTNQKGFFWNGLLKKNHVDSLGNTRCVLVAPSQFRRKILDAGHTRMGHKSYKNVVSLLSRNFTWPNLYNSVRQFCIQCLNRKTKPFRAPMGQMPVLTIPFEKVAIDLLGPFTRSRKGFKYLLTFICLASRYPESEPLRTTVEAAEVSERLLDIFAGHGLQSVCKMLEIESITTTPYHPQSNGAVERFHGTLVPC